MKAKILDKFGAIGAFFSLIAATGCPACFPLLGVIGATLGLGFLRPYEGIIMYVFQGFVLLSLIGNIFSYLYHKRMVPLIVGVASPALIFFAFYIYFSYLLIYVGLVGLFIAGILNYIANKKCKTCEVKQSG